MKTKSTSVGKVARVITWISTTIGFVVIAAIGIACVWCLAVQIIHLVKMIIP